MIELRKEVAHVGLCDGAEGKMWFCVCPENSEIDMLFGTKKECEKYIRQTFSGEEKKSLLERLKNTKEPTCYYE